MVLFNKFCVLVCLAVAASASPDGLRGEVHVEAEIEAVEVEAEVEAEVHNGEERELLNNGGGGPQNCNTGSTGFSWCPSLGRCIRPWETTCPGNDNGGGTNCITIYDPVLCTVGQNTYDAERRFSNECEANVAGYFGCRSANNNGGGTGINCPTVYAPVWCHNRATFPNRREFSNQCEADGAGFMSHQCFPVTDDDDFYDNDDNNIFCPATWDPVLCSRGFMEPVEFSNQCRANVDGRFSPSQCQPSNGGGHGGNHNNCLASAGYSWCQSLNRCIRSFETTCPARGHSNSNGFGQGGGYGYGQGSGSGFSNGSHGNSYAFGEYGSSYGYQGRNGYMSNNGNSNGGSSNYGSNHGTGSHYSF